MATVTELALGAIGVSADQELAYRLLLRGHGAGAAAVARGLRISPQRARDLLRDLQEKGLVTQSVERPVRYLPAAPATAIELLIHQRQEELDRVRGVAMALVEEFSREAPSGPRDVVEVVRPAEAVRARYAQLLGGARHELLVLQRLPVGQPTEQWTRFKLGILGRGVRGRAVYEPVVLEVPGVAEFAATVASAGEVYRVALDVPLTMYIVDREVGYLPLHARQDNVEEYLLVHRCALLDALVVLFDSVWDRATPVAACAVRRDVLSDLAAGEPSPVDQRLLAFMAAGLADEAIARQLGLGVRTVERRLSRLMRQLGARTRFQAAVLVTRRGWVGDSETPTPQAEPLELPHPHGAHPAVSV